MTDANNIIASSDAQAVIDYVQSTGDPEELEPGKIYLLTDSDGTRRIVDTDQYADHPRSARRSVTIWDAESFLNYTARHIDDSAEVWADETKRTIAAIFDSPTAEGGPAYAHHRATLQLQHTDEWNQWLKANGTLNGQEEFAEFLEDHLDQVVSPAGAVMLELAQSFHANTKVTFESSKFIDNGARALEFREDIDAKAGRKGQIAIPTTFDIAVAPFIGGASYRVIARLKWRIRDGHLSIGYKLDQPEKIVRAAFDDVVVQVGEGVPVRVNFGQA